MDGKTSKLHNGNTIDWNQLKQEHARAGVSKDISKLSPAPILRPSAGWEEEKQRQAREGSQQDGRRRRRRKLRSSGMQELARGESVNRDVKPITNWAVLKAKRRAKAAGNWPTVSSKRAWKQKTTQET
jgi:hypothetical protein